MSLITVHNATKYYQQGSKTIHAVHGVNLTVEPGEFIVIVGPSGSGKSTLLQLLGGLDRPTSGDVTVNGVDLMKASDRKLTALRRDTIGFVFQSFNLIPTLTAAENVEAAISKRSRYDRARVQKLLDSVGLASRSHHLPSKLSGGEQQRVALARALVNNPALFLADEPTGNLDSKTGEGILDIFRKLNQESGKTVILITHNDYARKFASRVYVMRDGVLTT